MLKKELVIKDVEQIVDIICDSCGQSCDKGSMVVGGDDKNFEYATISANWGYMSDNKDLESHTAQICDHCFDTKLAFIKFRVVNTFTGKVRK